MMVDAGNIEANTAEKEVVQSLVIEILLSI